jgi:lysophospholipase L1-like esterase
MMNTRRAFLKKTVIAGAAIGLSDSIITQAMQVAQPSKITLADGDIILFQGDSITDAGRNRTALTPNTSSMMGGGYAILAAGMLLHRYAEKKLTVYNKGISGDKVFQLADRWDVDCIKLKPNVLSILVGVNDYWHTRNRNYSGTAKLYEQDYRALLERTKKALPDVRLIIGEPYVVNGVKSVDDSWLSDFENYRAAARKLAAEFGAVFIPYQQVYDDAQKRATGAYWTSDGVHASLAGAQLMAEAWMQAFA